MDHRLIIFCVVMGLSFSSVSASPCNAQESRPCTCSTPEGVISLQTLMDSQPNQAPLHVLKDAYTYYLAPCNRPIMEPPCQKLLPSIVGCQVQGNNAYALGSQNHYTIMGDPQKDTVMFINSFLSASENVNRIMKLALKCSQEDAVFTFENQTSSSVSPKVVTYYFLLQTKYACLNPSTSSGGGLSAGSVLVILFFVVIVIYLVGGTLFLRYVRKAEGRETIPNYEFWTDFPSLVKDGVLFTVRGCKAESTYEKI